MVDVRSTDRFKFFYLDNDIVMFTHKDDFKKLDVNLDEIANHTKNTWEKNRSQKEITSNTLQGKVAEELFVDLINYNNRATANHADVPNNAGTEIRRRLAYIPYDDFRQDSFKKHAPFDGILIEKKNHSLSQIIESINRDVSTNRYGIVTDETLSLCRENRAYLVEIKSSKVPDKIYKSAGLSPIKEGFQRNIINKLKKLDLFKYPKFNRTNGGVIHNASDYLIWVRENRAVMRGKSDKDIIEAEIQSSLDIYTRIFIDDNVVNKDGKAVFVGYLFGYVLGREFYENVTIMNFPSKKSEKAIYVTFPIKDSTSFDTLFDDDRLWG